MLKYAITARATDLLKPIRRIQQWFARAQSPTARTSRVNLTTESAPVWADPTLGHLQVLYLERAKISDFLMDWIRQGQRAPTPREQERQFCEFLNAIQHALGASCEQLSRILHVSPSTIARWSSGNAAPHPVTREKILFSIARALRENRL